MVAATVFIFSGCSIVPVRSGSSVKIEIHEHGFELLVNEKPFYIQGAGVGQAFGKKGENYLRMAKELGANAVRTWGTDQGTRAYLDEAYRQGLYVDAGVWMNYVDEKKTVSYIVNDSYCRKKEKETLDYVKSFRNHPAILMWNLGNEAIHFTKSEDERIAFCRFLERLIQKVHRLDPHHPVIYASAATADLPYLKKYVPSLDVVGMNVYGNVIMAQSDWETLGFKVPYALTEFGHSGVWDVAKDCNGKVIEQSDYAKSIQYRNAWNLLKERRGKNIGGFVFHLGETTQASLTFYNINDWEYRTESFLTMRRLFGAEPEVLHAPRIEYFLGTPEEIAKGKPFTVTLKVKDVEKDGFTYSYKVSTTCEDADEYYVNTEVPVRIEGVGPKVVIYAPSQEGIYRVYGFVRDSKGNSTSTNHTIKVI